MFYRRCSAAAVAVIVVTAAWTTCATNARASAGPGCEAGAPCPDSDGDGYVACGCAPAGVACDCDDHDPNAFPGAPERCDSTTDLDCDGVAGSACGDMRGCLRGMCVMQCPPLQDFGCGIGNQCEQQPNGLRLCSAPDCTAFGCLPGFTCDDTKTCVPDCTLDVKCPFGERCRGTNCTDPCASVTCGAGSTCEKGQCIASCDCSPGSSGCAAGETCDRSLPVARCVKQACAGVACPAGSHCSGGGCVDDCAGVVCPPKLVCRHVAKDAGVTRGECVDLCPPETCPLPKVCDWHDGSCHDPKYREAGLFPVPTVAVDDDVLFAAGAGMTCNMHGLAGASATGAVASGLSLALLFARRARRRRR